MEDKQEICDLLRPALQATTCCKTLLALEYTAVQAASRKVAQGDTMNGGSEYVIATFKNNISGAKGYKSIDVTMDSGIQMMRDIVNGLY